MRMRGRAWVKGHADSEREKRERHTQRETHTHRDTET